jgi:hypothetical protein
MLKKPGANPTSVSYKASAVKTDMGNHECVRKCKIFSTLKYALVYCNAEIEGLAPDQKSKLRPVRKMIKLPK